VERERIAQPEPEQAPATATPAAPALVPAGAPALSMGTILSLQRGAGNAAVAGMLARQAVPADAGPVDAGPLPAGGSPAPTPEEEIAEFRKKPFPPQADFHPSSGIGQFDAGLDAARGALTITLKVAYNFVDGSGPKAKGFRADELKWKPEEQAEWKTQYQTSVSAQWSAPITMKSTKPGWDAVTVTTKVVVAEDAGDPHFILTVAKYPKDAPMVQSSICPPGTHHDGNACLPNDPTTAGGSAAPHGTAEFDSNDLRPESKLDWGNAATAVPFASGKFELDAAGTAALQPMIDQAKANPAARVLIRGRASTTPPHGKSADEAEIANMDIARQRSASVQAALVAGGVSAANIQAINSGQRGAGPGKEWRRVDVQLATQQTQDVGVHETGHMLGLGDEYLEAGEATGAPVEAGYGAMVQTQTGAPVTKANDASAMSMGSTVRPAHFSSFLEALKRVSGMQEWSL